MWILTLFAALDLGVRTAPSCSPSPACSCSDEWQVRDKEHLRSLVPRAAAVFEGVVLASEWGPHSVGLAVIGVRVSVGRRWRGASAYTVTVATPRSPATACGVDFAPGARYLIFADTARNGRLFTSTCVPTRRWDATADTLASWLGTPEQRPPKPRIP